MATLKQLRVRSAFKHSCRCFNIQPDEDPSPPPASGPRGRDWWYNQAGASGLWYYNYFMKQSLNSFLDNTIPDYCIKTDIPFTFVQGAASQGEATKSTYGDAKAEAWRICSSLSNISYGPALRSGVYGQWGKPYPNVWCQATLWKFICGFYFPATLKKNNVFLYGPFSRNFFKLGSVTVRVSKRNPSLPAPNSNWWHDGGAVVYNFNSNNYYLDGGGYYFRIFIPSSALSLDLTNYFTFSSEANYANNPIPAYNPSVQSGWDYAYLYHPNFSNWKVYIS